MRSSRELKERQQKFWERFAEIVARERLDHRAKPSYVRHAQRFVEWLPRRLREIEPADLDRYFAELGRNTAVAAWQAAQAVDAISLLMIRTVDSAWEERYPWRARQESFSVLEDSHSTLARREALDTPLVESEGHLTEQDADLLNALVRTIRQRRLAYRTEETYCQWARRWLAYERAKRSSSEGDNENFCTAGATNSLHLAEFWAARNDGSYRDGEDGERTKTSPLTKCLSV